MALLPRLLEQVRQRIPAKHYSYRTEKTYLHWIRRFILFHDRRHPRELGGTEVERFLTAARSGGCGVRSPLDAESGA
jgi:hypothetical protein